LPETVKNRILKVQKTKIAGWLVQLKNRAGQLEWVQQLHTHAAALTDTEGRAGFNQMTMGFGVGCWLVDHHLIYGHMEVMVGAGKQGKTQHKKSHEPGYSGSQTEQTAECRNACHVVNKNKIRQTGGRLPENTFPSAGSVRRTGGESNAFRYFRNV
jgi:hypothetical protein